MEREKAETYTEEHKGQILKECLETGKYGAAAKKHGIPPTTVYGWIRRYKSRDTIKKRKQLKGSRNRQLTLN